MKYLRVVIYDLKVLFRRKDVIFWTIIFPLFWLLMVAFIFVPPEKAIKIDLNVGIIDLDETENTNTTLHLWFNWTNVTSVKIVTRNFTDVLVKYFLESNGTSSVYFHIRKYYCESNVTLCIEELIIKKDLDIVIAVLNKSSLNYTLWLPVKLKIGIKSENPSQYYQLLGYVINPLVSFNLNNTFKRINMSVSYAIKGVKMWFKHYHNVSNTTLQFVSSEDFEKFMHGWLFGIAYPLWLDFKEVRPSVLKDRSRILGWNTLGAIGFMMMYTVLTSAIGTFVFKHSEGILRRQLSTPIRLRDLVIIDLVTTILLIFISSLVIVVVGLALGARFTFNILNLNHLIIMPILALSIIFTHMLGLIFAPLIKSPRAASSLGVALGLFIVFTTGIWWPPKEMLIEPLRYFADNFPPSLAIDVIRDLIIWNREIGQVLESLVKIVLGTLVMIAMVIFTYWKRFEKYLQRFI